LVEPAGVRADGRAGGRAGGRLSGVWQSVANKRDSVERTIAACVWKYVASCHS
jgi:hypothetical protein